MNVDHFPHIIFDFDLTLVKLHIDWTVWHRGIRKIINAFDKSTSLHGEISQQDINTAIQKFGQSLHDELWSYGENFELSHITGNTLLQPVVQFLKNLPIDQKKYILTSNASQTVLPILREHDLAKYFSKVITRTDVMFVKPHPQPFELLHDGKSPLSDYLMIGDSNADEGFANNVGISFLNVRDI